MGRRIAIVVVALYMIFRGDQNIRSLKNMMSDFRPAEAASNDRFVFHFQDTQDITAFALFAIAACPSLAWIRGKLEKIDARRYDEAANANLVPGRWTKNDLSASRRARRSGESFGEVR